MPERICSIDGCEKPAKARGWCKTHWARWQKHGDPEYSRERTTACAVDGCDKPPRSAFAEHCEMHYGRLRRNGTTDARELLERYTDDRGYVLVKRAGHPMADIRGYVYEHRLVVAEKLGRILESSEYVHHIDGTTTNNHPDNLAIVNGSQHSRIHWLERKGVDLRRAVEMVLA